MGSRNNKPGRIVKGTALQPSLKSASGVWSLDEAMQAHRANAWPQPNLFQPVGNSLRLKNSSSTSLARRPSRPGNQRTWTWSGWVKRGLVDLNYHSFFCGGNASDYIAFWNDNSLVVSNFNGTDYIVRTTQLFRDPSAWYHLVITMDTTQATSSNRIKIYVNGAQVTSFAGSTYPSQNYTTKFNANTVQYLGYNEYNYFDGQIGEVNFVDGYALQPTLFGQYDTNNTWVPVPYTGTYGTNGFYLPFTNATTSQTLGYDASLTGTATYDVDQDPYRGSVALHLTGNGPAGGNNNTFADSSTNNLAITCGGDTTQGSFSPFPLNTNTPYNPAVHGASAYFDGSGDRLVIATNASLDLTGDFTIEMWVNLSSLPSYSMLFDTSASGTAGSTMTELWVESSGAVVYYVRGSALLTTASSTITANTWNHIAIVKSGTSQVLYVNGSSRASATSSTQPNTGYSWFIGDRIASSPSGNYPIAGYISNFRITKGAAIYTAAFTPTNRPFGTLTNNLLTFSEDFVSNGGWGAANITIQPNATIAPDGTPSGTGLLSSNNDPYLTQTISVTNGVTYTASIYVKGSANTIGKTGFLWWWIAGTATGANTFSPYFVYTKDWQRISVSFTPTGSGTVVLRLEPGDGAQTPPAAAGDISYIWGAQVEVSSSAGNYTPTPANFSTAPSLLLNFANAAVVDSSGANNLVTVSNATITSASKYGSGALTFNGTSDYLNGRYIPPIGTGDFTVETWCRLPNVTPTGCWRAMITLGAYSASGGLSLFAPRQSAPANTAVAILNTVNPTIASSTNINDNQWHHVALVRNRTRLSLYVDGREEGTTSNNDNITQTILYIGADPGCGSGGIGGAGQTYYQGALEDIRITVGVARYTSDFTPSARALPEVGGKSFVTTNVNAGVVQQFTTTGTSSWTAPVDVTSVEVLVVAGGAGGASGGGGAGGVIYNNQYAVTPGQTYTVTVGAGGTGGTGSTSGAAATNGGVSQFGNLTATGGGAGARTGNTGDTSGAVGGSGGGGGGYSSGTVAGGAGTAGQGFAGGSNGNQGGSPYPAGGGGGAGAAAANVSASTVSTAGGIGLQFGISGTPTYYAGGGGGGSYGGGTAGAGGTGGGGAGGSAGGGTAGTANTGGGGGGANGSTTGGAGGSGVVIVRYTTTAVGNTSDATTDNLTDSPTLYGHDTGAGGEVVGNYATWNPLLGANNQAGSETTIASSVVVLSNGNLNASNPTAAGQAPRMQVHSNIGMPSGKWYAEFTGLSGRGPGISLGDYIPTSGSGSGISHAITISPSGAVNVSNGASATITGTAVAISTTDVVGVAFDADNRVCYYYRNGVLTQTASNITTTLGPPYFASNSWFFSSQPESSGAPSAIIANFGQRAWAYTPPAGYNALTTKNFARLAIGSAAATPNQFFDAVTYTGTGATQSITSLNFQPDFVWIKNRTNVNNYNHSLYDSVRGATKQLVSSATDAEDTNAAGVTAFNSNGFTVGSYVRVNASSDSHVAWCWKANGAAVSNTSGTITSSVSANTTSGFSIVTYTGTGSAATVGHGLGTALSMVTIKQRNGVNNWPTWHSGISGGTGYYVYWDSTNGLGTSTTVFNGTNPTSSVFSVGTNSLTNGSTNTYVAYCWTEIPGFSKFGSYTANGSADGPFIYCGFKPRFIMIKSTSASSQWVMIDTARDTFNSTASRSIFANGASAEETGNTNEAFDIVSNGFKLRSNGRVNVNTVTHIFMAFADKPFGNVNGTAR